MSVNFRELENNGTLMVDWDKMYSEIPYLESETQEQETKKKHNEEETISEKVFILFIATLYGFIVWSGC